MARNNTVIFTGNMGDEITLIEGENPFAVFSIATTDSYLDENNQWQQKKTIWHKVLAFNPQVVARLKSLKKGSRIEVTGSLDYKPFPTVLEDGRTVDKYEAAIFAGKVEQKPLVKKSQAE